MINLYIDVLDNSAPSFVGGLQTTYRMEVGDKRSGKIPFYEDDEDHDVIAFLNAVPGYEFPPFVDYHNKTEDYDIVPDADNYAGKTYRFNVVLQEANSDVMVTSETIKIIMGGNSTDEAFEKKQAYMIIDVDRDSTGFLNFSTEVNTTWVCEHWKTKLTAWVIDTTRKRQELISFRLPELEKGEEPLSQTSINFTATFHEPYLLGLLNKKRDYLYFELADAEEMILDA